MTGHSINYSTVSGPSATLVPSGGELTPEKLEHAVGVVRDYGHTVQERDGLTWQQREEAILEVLMILGLEPSPPPLTPRRLRE